MEQTYSTLKSNLSPLVRREELDGSGYLVFPAIILTEGVHNGSHGPLYYPAAAIEKSVPGWNHRPVLVDHPKLNGKPASSCSPAVLRKQKVGFLLNAEYVKDGGKLRVECWIDEAKAGKVAPALVQRVTAGQMVEVSTGLFTTDKTVQNAAWNGEPYKAETGEYMPDHLAVFVDGQRGACSIADGAGAPRLNAEGEPVENKEGLNALTDKLRVLLNPPKSRAGLEAAPPPSCWIREVFTDAVVYERQGTLYRQAFRADKAGKITLEGEPVEVVSRTEYLPVENLAVEEGETEEDYIARCMADEKLTTEYPDAKQRAAVAHRMWKGGGKRNQAGDGSLADKRKENASMEVKEFVTRLIANENTPFTEAQREALETMPAAVLEKLTPPPPVQNAEPPKDVAGVIAAAPEALRPVLNAGQAALAREQEAEQAKRNALIEKLTKHPRCKLNAEQLAAKGSDELQALIELAGDPPAADPAGLVAGGQKRNAGTPTAAPLPMPEYKFGK